MRSPPIRRRLRCRRTRRSFARSSRRLVRTAGSRRAKRSTPPRRRSSAIRPTARPTESSGRFTRRSANSGALFRPGDDPAQYSARAIAALEKSRRDAGLDVNLELMLGRLVSQCARLCEGDCQSAARSLTISRVTRKGAMLLAAAQDGAEQTEDEIRTLETALEENPSFYRASLRLAELYERQRRFVGCGGCVRPRGGSEHPDRRLDPARGCTDQRGQGGGGSRVFS